METAVSTSSQDKQADASTERDSCLADDAQDGLGALSTACEVSGEHSRQSRRTRDPRPHAMLGCNLRQKQLQQGEHLKKRCKL